MAETGKIQDKFTAEEWDILCSSPISIFCMVAAADGKVDKKEFMEFAKIIIGLKLFDHELIKSVYAGTVEGIEAKFNSVIKNLESIKANVKRVRPILKGKVDDKIVDEFCKSLLFLGHRIASSSGGFLGLGSKVSKEEKEMLIRIAAMLDVEYN